MEKLIRYNVNVCDNICNDLEIHFTKACENNCAFCIDKLNKGIDESPKPDVHKIFTTILEHANKIDYIGIAGGEPCLYLDELLELCQLIRKYLPEKKLNLITSMPEICYREKEKFFEILSMCDTIFISPQHHNQKTADEIRRHKSSFDREAFYKEIPYKGKITVTINLIKGYLDTFDDVKDCIMYYDNLGFAKIKLCELSKCSSLFVDLQEVLGICLPSAFASGCSIKNYDTSKLFPKFSGELTLKRTCFYNNCKHKATIWDFIKVCTRWMFRKKYFFGVVYGNGNIYKYWK